jgi:predicted metal-dependent hydrolase
MSKKSPKIADLIQGCHGYRVDPHYAGYFECFNQQLFFEAHEVLEELWLEDRHGPNGAFYKGLIQLAGAFVHLQKNRPGPAAALFNLARTNLAHYGAVHEHLSLTGIMQLIEAQRGRLTASSADPRTSLPQFPELHLLESAFL